MSDEPQCTRRARGFRVHLDQPPLVPTHHGVAALVLHIDLPAQHVELLRRGGPCGLLTQQPGRIELGEARREPVRADRRAGGLELLDELRHAREGTAAASRL